MRPSKENWAKTEAAIECNDLVKCSMEWTVFASLEYYKFLQK